MDEKKTIRLSGDLEPSGIADLPEHAVLDFSEVTSVSFAATRALIALREKARDIEIVNAPDEVCLFFESSGVDRLIPVGRRPVEVDLSSWRTAGDANQGDCYFDETGDRMVKLFRDRVLFASARKEAQGAFVAFVSGIPTPLVGGEVSYGGRVGIMYECARNKRSVSRLIADDPDRIDEYMTIFSDMCKRLHQTPCDTALADSVSEGCLDRIAQASYLSDEQRRRLVKVIEDTEPATTCVHGDLHVGNLVICDAGPQFIDMGEFGYGNPLFDLGTAYFTAVASRRLSSSIVETNFHFSVETMEQVWRLFLKHYFGAETDAQREEAERLVIPYAMLRSVTLCNITEKLAPPIFKGYMRQMDELFFSRP